MWIPVDATRTTINGMDNRSGRYKRSVIETLSKNGQPFARRVSPMPTRFAINLNMAQVPLDYRNSEYAVWIEDMQNYIEQCITGLRFSSESIVLNITFGFRQLEPGILGQCGPGDGTWNPLAYLADLRLDATNAVATVRHATMVFSTDYFQLSPVGQVLQDWKQNFFRTAVHECFHACGLGATWNGPFRIVTALPFVVTLPSLFAYNVVGTGNPLNPNYTASLGLAAWRETMQGQGTASGIPIENVGMTATTIMTQSGGTALAHWRSNGGSSNLTGIRDYQGRDLAAEVMTAYSSARAPDAWVGRFTLASLRDIGWEVDYLPLQLDFWNYKTDT